MLRRALSRSRTSVYPRCQDVDLELHGRQLPIELMLFKQVVASCGQGGSFLCRPLKHAYSATMRDIV